MASIATEHEQATHLDEVERPQRHRLWVRLTHWLLALAVLTLIVSGITILMAHPRFYWGNGGNELMPPLFEVPLGPNGRGAQWSTPVDFFDRPANSQSSHAQNASVQSASRLSEPWNANAWARSLHFLAAWVFVAGLGLYLLLGIVTGHARRNLLPRRGDGSIWQDVRAHLTWPMAAAGRGSPYSVLQKLAYVVVAFVALPLMFLTGITMSPAIAAQYPWLLDLFGGLQSARTVHFLSFVILLMFVCVHLAMVALTGWRRQLRGMIWGE